MASSTSLPTTTASSVSGRRSSHSIVRAEMRQTLLLAPAQIGAQLDDAVALDEAAQRAEDLLGQRPAPGPELDHRAHAGDLQRLADLRRQRAAEQRRHLGRGDEVRPAPGICPNLRCGPL